MQTVFVTLNPNPIPFKDQTLYYSWTSKNLNSNPKTEPEHRLEKKISRKEVLDWLDKKASENQEQSVAITNPEVSKAFLQEVKKPQKDKKFLQGFVLVSVNSLLDTVQFSLKHFRSLLKERHEMSNMFLEQEIKIVKQKPICRIDIDQNWADKLAHSLILKELEKAILLEYIQEKENKQYVTPLIVARIQKQKIQSFGEGVQRLNELIRELPHQVFAQTLNGLVNLNQDLEILRFFDLGLEEQKLESYERNEKNGGCDANGKQNQPNNHLCWFTQGVKVLKFFKERHEYLVTSIQLKYNMNLQEIQVNSPVMNPQSANKFPPNAQQVAKSKQGKQKNPKSKMNRSKAKHKQDKQQKSKSQMQEVQIIEQAGNIDSLNQDKIITEFSKEYTAKIFANVLKSLSPPQAKRSPRQLNLLSSTQATPGDPSNFSDLKDSNDHESFSNQITISSTTPNTASSESDEYDSSEKQTFSFTTTSNEKPKKKLLNLKPSAKDQSISPQESSDLKKNSPQSSNSTPIKKKLQINRINSDFKRQLFFHDEIEEFVKKISAKSDHQRHQKVRCIQQLGGIIKSLLHYSYIGYYGSIYTGLDLEESDVDVMICGYELCTYQQILGHLNTLHLELDKNHRQFIKNLKLIQGNIPLLKLELDAGRDKKPISVDLTWSTNWGPQYVNQHNGFSSTLLISEWIRQFNGFREVLLILKYLLKKKNLNDAFLGGISSYCLTIMLAAVYLTFTEPVIDKRAALLQFLDFYGNKFNPQVQAININQFWDDFHIHPSPFIQLEEQTFHPLTVYSPTNQMIISNKATKSPEIFQEFREFHAYLKQNNTITEYFSK